MITLHVTAVAPVPLPYLRREERAIVQQVNRDVHAFWPATPKIRFSAQHTASSWEITLLPPETPTDDQLPNHLGYSGWHERVPGTNAQTAEVARARSLQQTSVTLDHEVVEMITDSAPKPPAVDICDPVEYASYAVGSAWLSDFVTPAYFRRGRRGRTLDFAGVVTRPGQLTFGY